MACADPITVICLCAAWCRTCEAYRPVFDRVTGSAPALTAHWLDIEDEADQLGDLDIDTFPTLLIARAHEPLFYGPMLPHAAALEQLIDRLSDAVAPPWQGDARVRADLRALLATLAPLPTLR